MGPPTVTASPTFAPVKIVARSTSLCCVEGVLGKFSVSVPAIPANKMPVVGNVTFVAPVEVKVVEKAPAVASVLPFPRANVAPVPGSVIDISFILVTVAAPKTGVINVGVFEKTTVPAPVSSVITLAS